MRVEPTRDFIEEWALGCANIHVPIPAQYANWAVWYLGYDESLFQEGDVVDNGTIVSITEACKLRLEELST